MLALNENYGHMLKAKCLALSVCSINGDHYSFLWCLIVGVIASYVAPLINIRPDDPCWLCSQKLKAL